MASRIAAPPLLARPRAAGLGLARLRTGDAPWLAIVLLVTLALCGLPYLISARFGPADLDRLGTFWFVRDFSQYQAAMREGARQAGWLIHDHFSAEPHPPVLMYPLYVGAGKLAARVGLDPLGVFSALEWLGRGALILALYAFAATFLGDRRQRQLMLLLALGTLGLDAWSLPLRALLDGVGAHPLAGLLPETINVYLEMSSFGVLLSAPHLMLGLALTLLCGVLYLHAIAPGRSRWAWLVALGLAVLGLSLVHAFNVPVLVSALAMHALWSGRRAWPAASLAALAAAPMTVYSLLIYQTDPFWSGTYGAQNLMPAPPPWAVPFDFGLVLLAAPLAWPVLRDWPADRRRLLLLWVGLGLLAMYAPVPYQRRFAFGVEPGLAVLAAAGLVWLNGSLQRRGWSLRRRLLNDGLTVAAASTSALVYVALLASAAFNAPAAVYLWTRPEAETAAWLAAHSSSQDVVLASTDFANPLAGAIDGRVVHGHIVATLHSAAKAALVARFYSPVMTAEERTQILAETGASIVALGPHEQALGAKTDALRQQPDLQLIYQRDGVQLYHVVTAP